MTPSRNDDGVVWCQSFQHLGNILARTEARFVTYVARWRELTVAVSRALAAWAAEDPRRGCGVATPQGFRIMGRLSPAVKIAEPEERIVHFNGSAHGQIVNIDGSDQGRLRDGILDLAGITPVGLAMTGHGSEHCVLLGDYWLVADEKMAIGPNIIMANEIKCGVLLLNRVQCCGSVIRLSRNDIH